ncbi:hypothetical protein SUGI_0774780 [Cryptomeria japonica]|nr:hypothetical protein SUGI_0774780 [Cryptomeria japonica]
MASTSTAGRKRKNEDNAFDEVAPSASTSASTLLEKPCYDVFINHRGPDVKHTLASTIYNILKEIKVTAFLDSEELEYGDFLPTTLESVMRSASIHIAIFSENYAKSPWCLAELSFMLKTGAKIIPVFYYVEPTDLRYVAQGKGIYVDAFVQYDMKGRYSPEKLQEWKAALHNVSFYDGQIIKNNDDEMRLLKKIVNIVMKEVNNVPLVVANHPVGLEETIEDFEMNTLQSDHGDRGVQIVGIWGMGGSGKTTLAKYLYNKKSSSMERSSFIFDVRDGAVKGVLHNKQIQLLKDLGVKKEDRKFDNIEQGKALLKRNLRSVRVLIVLDDLDHVDQLDALLPAKDSLGWGSLIIVTTRENEVLRSKGISSVYKMKALDPFYAEQLFCWHAFLQSIPLSGFEKLVKMFLDVCNGLPLSLKVFGGQLYGELRKEYWESLLQKILRILPNDIKEKLKISYEALDYEEKEMFLDTACFFIGEDSSLAIEIWNGSGWSGLHGWEKLFNKCLVELDKKNHIKMHDHLRDLGREIANQHSPFRLWLPQQIINAERQTEKRTAIRGIMAVPSSMITWTSSKRGMSYQTMKHVSEEIMDNTIGGDWSLAPSLLGPKIFVTRRDYFNKVIDGVSRELVWLRWFEIGQRNLPSWLSLKNLRVLEIYEQYDYEGEHHLEELWEADRDAPVQLRQLVISGCNKFQRFPNSIGRLNMLRKITIRRSYNLTRLPDEFCRLQSLEHLQLCDCNQLSSLPTSFGNLKNLRFLDLSHCRKLTMVPDSFKKLMRLQYLDLQSCDQLILMSEDFQNITKLEYINLNGCDKLEELPRHITNQASLRKLRLDWTVRLRELPINIGQLSKLQKMIIGGTELLTSLPTSLGELSSLTDLSFSHCASLESLPASLGKLSSLTDLLFFHCPSLEYLPASLGNLSSLTYMSIGECPSLHSLPTSLGNLPSLKNLTIDGCLKLESLPTSFGDLSSLTHLSIYCCPRLKCLPHSVERLNLLEYLEIEDCPVKVDFGAASLPIGLSNLKDIRLTDTEICRISISEDRYPRLESLFLFNNPLTEIEALSKSVKSIELASCRMLKNIRVTCDLVNLEFLKIKSCPELEELPSFTRLTSLREFELLCSCYRIQKIEGLEYCTRLESLRVDTSWEVAGIESLERMEKLRRVELRGNKGSAIERCIQTIKKWPDEMQICMHTVPDASSLVDSFLSLNVMVADSFSNRKFGSRPELVNMHSSDDDAIMLCFVINCVTPQMTPGLTLLGNGDAVSLETLPELEKGRWAWIGVFTSQGRGRVWQTAEKFEIDEETDEQEYEGEDEQGDEQENEGEDVQDDEPEEEEDEEENELERGLVVSGEQQRVVEAFHFLLSILQSR